MFSWTTLGVQGVLFGVCVFAKKGPHCKQPHFEHMHAIIIAWIFSVDIVNVVREYFDISLWFTFLDCKEVKNYISEFEYDG